ncbi:hypothetical protein [Phascolarctobacterium succinatutens]|uniref:hypothetical protein n=1 Tax=Phascolarctobacterium succinatutens TaxID=626940 RepID=UPI00307CFA0C
MKKILALALACSTFATSAFAEQPKAAEYRQVMSSGNYYVEYELNDVKKCLAVKDGKRMDYTIYAAGANPLLAAIPIIGLASFFIKTDKKEPSALYMNGKYYQFQGKKKATMAYYNQLDDENLDPKEGWSSIRYRLALPEELVVFAPNDVFNSFTNFKAPTYIGSGQTKGAKVVLDYDKYSSTVKNKAGGVLFEKLFYMYYKEGNLQNIKTFIKMPGSDETLLNTMKVKKITQELPEGALQIPKGCKVYAVGIGDMNDLLEQPVLVEDYSDKEE